MIRQIKAVVALAVWNTSKKYIVKCACIQSLIQQHTLLILLICMSMTLCYESTIAFMCQPMAVFEYNCGIRHVTVPIATRILIANVRHIGLSNICVINLEYFKMQV